MYQKGLHCLPYLVPTILAKYESFCNFLPLRISEKINTSTFSLNVSSFRFPDIFSTTEVISEQILSPVTTSVLTNTYKYYHHLLRYAVDWQLNSNHRQSAFSYPHPPYARLEEGVSWLDSYPSHKTWIRKAVECIMGDKAL